MKNIILFSMVLAITANAAEVNDIDKNAFITKAEFDSLKNQYQSILDKYNSTVEYKVDDAIASYVAGVTLDVSHTVASNVETYEWPLTIINKLKVIENIQTSDTNTVGNEAVWRPGFSFLATAYRGSKIVTQNFNWKCVDKIKSYLNGTANTTDGTFKVSNICFEPTMSFSTAFQHENLTSDSAIYSSVFIDCYNNVTAGSSWGSSSNWTRRYIREDYRMNVKASEYEPYIIGIHHPGGTITWRGSGKNTYDTLTSGNTTWEITAAGPCNFSTMMTTNSYKYTNKKLNIVYNYGDSTNASHFAPTTQNNELYITNKKANRYAYTHVNKICWDSSRNTSTSNIGVNYIVSAGENLEHENEDTSRSWYLKSLISQNRLLYDVRTINNRIITNHKMVNGIPIFEYVQNKSVDSVKNVIVDFDLTSTVSSNAKYIIVSKRPIETQNYNADVEDISSYESILSINGVSTNAKKVQLAEGNNKIKIKEMNSGDILYIKILWNDTNEESVTISRPKITYTDVN